MLLPILKAFDWDFKLPSKEEMKTKGKLVEETKEEGDFVTTSIHYESFDGFTKISRVETIPKKKQKVLSLQEKLQQAIANENFEEAIKLRDELKGAK